MAVLEVTNNQLIALRDDIHRQQKISAAFYFFTLPRVDRFFKLNKMVLMAATSRMEEFVKLYVQHDEDGAPMTTSNERGGLEYVYETEEKKIQHQERLDKFLSLKTKMEI